MIRADTKMQDHTHLPALLCVKLIINGLVMFSSLKRFPYMSGR